MSKAITRVFDAINTGCRTADEVEAVTDIPRKEVSVWLLELLRAGLVSRREGRNNRLRKAQYGAAGFYEYSVSERAKIKVGAQG